MEAPVITQPVITYVGGRRSEQHLLKRLEQQYARFRRLQQDFRTLQQQARWGGESQGDLFKVQQELRQAHSEYRQLQERYDRIRWYREQFQQRRFSASPLPDAQELTVPSTSTYTALAQPAALSFSAEFAKGVFVDLYV